MAWINYCPSSDQEVWIVGVNVQNSEECGSLELIAFTFLGNPINMDKVQSCSRSIVG